MDDDMKDDPQFSQAELARLADGSLSSSRQTELRDQLSGSPDLARALGEQEQAVSLLRSADVPAPDSLRRWLESQAAETRSRRWRPAWLAPKLVLPAVAALAAVVAAVIVIASSGGSAAPTFSHATQAALAPATLPAPSRAGARTLDVSLAGIPFPYWEDTIGWRARGRRDDTLGGRRVVTVFYTGWPGRRVGYAIVGGPALTVPGGRSVTSHGIQFTLLRDRSARVVTWVRQGHTCIIAGRGMSYAQLLVLATADVPA
jgi:hypothetical protein